MGLHPDNRALEGGQAIELDPYPLTQVRSVDELDPFEHGVERVGQLGGDEVLATTAALVRGAIREADVAYRAGGDEFAVILPESARIEAEGLFARVSATMRRGEQTTSVSGGIAELEADDDALSLFERAEAALTRAKAVGRGTAA